MCAIRCGSPLLPCVRNRKRVWVFQRSSAVHFPMTTPQMVALVLTCMIRVGHEGFKAISILSPLGSIRSCLNVAVWSSSSLTTTMLPLRASRQGSTAM